MISISIPYWSVSTLKFDFTLEPHCKSHVGDKGKWTWLKGLQFFFLVEGGRGVKFHVCFGRGRLYLSRKYFITLKKYTGIYVICEMKCLKENCQKDKLKQARYIGSIRLVYSHFECFRCLFSFL